MTAALLPPTATPLERALADAIADCLDDAPDLGALWDPARCPAALLPFLAWGLSVDHWDPAWTEARKRQATADALVDQARKGTPASLRRVIDRFDPAIRLVEWFAADPPMEPHRVRLELPLAADSAVAYSDTLIAALLADLAAVKPLRVHLDVVHKLAARAAAFGLSGGTLAGFRRLAPPARPDPAPNAAALTTEIGEPMADEAGGVLEFA